jgi:alkaline phosphatase D
LVATLAVGYPTPSKAVDDEPIRNGDVALLRIAFGSCNDQEKSQSYWNNIDRYFSEKSGPGYPDVWVWAGDIVYADTENIDELEVAYTTVENGDYQRFARGCAMSSCKIVGIWDDHDFGNNNLAGDDPSQQSQFINLTKPQRKAALVNFLGEPTRSAVAERKQMYAAYDFERDGLVVRLNLLDLRYDRQNEGATNRIMGRDQWDWLRDSLMDEVVDFHLIVSTTQVLRTDVSKDTWAQFPSQREKLFQLIGDSPAQGILLLTGDIHAGEISRLTDDEARKYGIDFPLYEITSSGLNKLRCWGFWCRYDWENPYRESFVAKTNFGEIYIVRSVDREVVILATIRSSQSTKTEILLRTKVKYTPRT